MTVDELAAAIVKAFEGCRLHAYRDVARYWTIAWGHLLTRDRDADLSAVAWTQPQADEQLSADMAPVARAVRRLITAEMTPGEEAALRSFAFNLGAGRLQASTLRQKLNRGDYEGAADELLRYSMAGGRQVAGLLRRRRAERALFLS